MRTLFSDGQENTGKCPHLESDESDPSFGELSNGDDLKSPQKPDGPELEMQQLACNGAPGAPLGSPEGSKPKTDPEKKFTCSICGQAFRTKSYLNKHQHRVHKTLKVQGASGSGLNEVAPSLASPFSPQQNMSLLESFGFQIVQSAFASSLVDAEAGQSGMDFGGKWRIYSYFASFRTKPGCPQICSVSGNNFASRLFLFVIFAFVYLIFLSQTAIWFLLFLLFQSIKSLCIMFKISL